MFIVISMGSFCTIRSPFWSSRNGRDTNPRHRRLSGLGFCQAPFTTSPRDMSWGQTVPMAHASHCGWVGRHQRRPMSQAGLSSAPGRSGFRRRASASMCSGSSRSAKPGSQEHPAHVHVVGDVRSVKVSHGDPHLPFEDLDSHGGLLLADAIEFAQALLE